MKFRTTLLTATLVALSLPALQGCVTAVVGGAAVGALAVADRRSVGIQTEDEAIEWKASARVDEAVKEKTHINYTSFNRKVLITGEVPSEQIKQQVGEIVGKIENVQGTWNELVVAPTSSLSARSNDSFITSKVKARFVDANRFYANHVKVVTENGVSFLLGIVNEREAKAAIQVARTTDGVRKVVNVMEVVSEAETQRIDSAVTGGSKKSTEKSSSSSQPKTNSPFETPSPSNDK